MELIREVFLGLFSFTRDFGIAAHFAIETKYQAEHPGAIVGTTRGILGTRLKPDIFDGPNRVFMEIKPLSFSGIAKGIFQIGVYDATFTAFNLNYSTGTWPDHLSSTYVGTIPIAYFNVKGVIFYTDAIDSTEDLLSITTFAAARTFIQSGLASRTLTGALVRIGGLVEGGKTADTISETDDVAVATLITIF